MHEPRSRESNHNLLFNEVRNLSKRVNEIQTKLDNTIAALEDIAQANTLDIEQLSVAVAQLKNRVEYFDFVLKELKEP